MCCSLGNKHDDIVLRRVLCPEAHTYGIEKKKKDES